MVDRVYWYLSGSGKYLVHRKHTIEVCIRNMGNLPPELLVSQLSETWVDPPGRTQEEKKKKGMGHVGAQGDLGLPQRR